MAPIVESVEIARSPEEVFAYVDELSRHGEWQEQIVSNEVLTEGPTRVGTRVRQTRKVPGRQQTFTYEITEHDPPRKASFRGVDGPIRPAGTVTVEPAGDGRARVTLRFDLEGHGIGKLLAPLAKLNARKEIPKSHQRLKERLEQGTT
jgi:uncharacterized membrane protein